MQTACLEHLAIGPASLQEAARHGEGGGDETKANKTSLSPGDRQGGTPGIAWEERQEAKFQSAVLKDGEQQQEMSGRQVKLKFGGQNKLRQDLSKRLNHIRAAGKGEEWSCKPQESVKEFRRKDTPYTVLTEKNEWDNGNQGRAE